MGFVLDATNEKQQVVSKTDLRMMEHLMKCPICQTRMTEIQLAVMRHMLESEEANL